MTYQLGHTSTSTATNDSNGDGTVAVTGGIVASRSGTLVGGSAYVALLTGTGVRSQKVRMVIYADNAGVPGALVGVTDEVTVSNATTLPNYVRFPTWVNFGVPPKVVAGSTYWIGLWWGTVVNAANVEIGAVAVAGHVFFNSAETYSSSGNPPNSPTTDSGFAVDYDAYFDVNDGPPLHLPGRPSRKSRLAARSRVRPDVHVSRSRVLAVAATPLVRQNVTVKRTLKSRLAARLRPRPDAHILHGRSVTTPTPLVRNQVKVTHEAITRAPRAVRRRHKDVYLLRGLTLKLPGTRPLVKITRRARVVARLVHKQPRLLHSTVGQPAPVVRSHVTYERVTPRLARLVRSHRVKAKALRNPFIAPPVVFVRAKIVVKSAALRRPVLRRPHRPRILHGLVGRPAIVVRARVLVTQMATRRPQKARRVRRVRILHGPTPVAVTAARLAIVVSRAAARRPQLRRLRRPRLVHTASLTPLARTRVVVHTVRRLPLRRPRLLRFARNPIAQPAGRRGVQPTVKRKRTRLIRRHPAVARARPVPTATPLVRTRVVIVRQRAKIVRFVGHSRRFKLLLTRSHGGAPPAPFPYATLPTLKSGAVPDEGRGADPDISGWIKS